MPHAKAAQMRASQLLLVITASLAESVHCKPTDVCGREAVIANDEFFVVLVRQLNHMLNQVGQSRVAGHTWRFFPFRVGVRLFSLRQ